MLTALPRQPPRHPPLFRRTTALAVFLILVAVATGPGAPVRAAARPAVRGEHAMAVTVDPYATAVAVEILRDGGNAVDAAVAAAFVLAVTYPSAGSLGGGGFLLYRTPEGEAFALDFREVAPRALSAELFHDSQGKPVPERSLRGGLAVGVPGVVAGLAEAHERWGSLPWKALIGPAVALAEDGFVVSAWNAKTLRSREQDLLADPGTRAIFAVEGRLAGPGDRVVQADLSTTLRRVAAEGRSGFYEGPVADGIVRTVRSAGGVMSTADLTAYRAVVREPLRGTYRGYGIVSFPPPSSGGLVLLQIVGMLERFDLEASGFGSSLTVHRMAEAERRAYADRSRWLGDPEYADVPVEALLGREYIASRSRTIRSRKATPSRKIAPGTPPSLDTDETTHLSLADPSGGAVAMTITSNQWFGSGLMADGTGVVLNNEMDDFALAPGVPNLYGLIGGEANAPAGGKRPLSSMTPTIVAAQGDRGRPVLILGSPGGSRIISAVLQVIVNVIDHAMPLQEAVNAPRFHHQWLPDRIEHEPWAFPADVARELRARGHELYPTGDLANVSAIGLDDDGTWLGAADPRREGLATGF